MFFVDEAHNKSMKIERLQNRASPFKGVAEQTSSITRTQKDCTSGDRPPAYKTIDAPTAKLVTMAAPATKGEENSYAKPSASKCYRCGEPEHKSNECQELVEIES